VTAKPLEEVAKQLEEAKLSEQQPPTTVEETKEESKADKRMTQNAGKSATPVAPKTPEAAALVSTRKVTENINMIQQAEKTSGKNAKKNNKSAK
jgi:hypothetical protein